ncbi:MAG: hypothetical protein EOM72_12170 [Opitutae bacterium]|nr:hypothetical protein [Opitutae bacterium]
MKNPVTAALGVIALANISEGCHANGIITRVAEGAITKGQILKAGTAGNQVAPCSELTDKGLFVALDDAADGELVPCAVLGNYNGTVLVTAGVGGVAVGDTVSPIGTAVTSGLTVGRALTAATEGNYIELAHKVCA